MPRGTLRFTQFAPEPVAGQLGACRYCGGEKRGTASGCYACARQKERRGVTGCCGSIPVSIASPRRRKGRRGPPPSEYYCPNCPGDGRVSVVLVHPETGEEKETWHPARAKPLYQQSAGGFSREANDTRNRLTLEQIAARRGVDANCLVFTSHTGAIWGRGRLVVAVGELG